MYSFGIFKLTIEIRRGSKTHFSWHDARTAESQKRICWYNHRKSHIYSNGVTIATENINIWKLAYINVINLVMFWSTILLICMVDNIVWWYRWRVMYTAFKVHLWYLSKRYSGKVNTMVFHNVLPVTEGRQNIHPCERQENVPKSNKLDFWKFVLVHS